MARPTRTPQTPGTTPTDATAGTEQTAEAGAPGATDGEDAGGDAVVDAPARSTKKAGKAPLGRDDYLKMRAHDVDAKALTKSVLTLDGWVVPDLPPVAPQRA